MNYGVRDIERANTYWSKIRIVNPPDGKEKLGPCHVYSGRMSPEGYGRMTVEQGKDASTHRWIFQKTIRDLDVGETLDHVCWNQPCQNTDHLDPCGTVMNTKRSALLAKLHPENYPELFASEKTSESYLPEPSWFEWKSILFGF